ILLLRDVSKSVRTAAGELKILEGISVEIKRGESVAVVGASGSGKTTLLGLMAGLDVPTSGRILFDGHDLTSMDEEERAHLRGRLVGFVFQTFQLLGSLTALENVMLPIELRGDSSAQSAAAEVLRRVGLGERFDHYPKQLSGGEQQRVAIARAFASNPTVLFADEPTGNLDTRTGELVTDLLFELNREYQTTLVLVTHDVRVASRCNRSLFLDAGHLVSADDESVAPLQRGAT
ncbi:MAG: ABC transporter ATP-binding protein, partial [Gammaproteobacteria bacterium]|nr:ABC transporter ATP-binding protein [Gammaproteobacteria bacterium]